ncbi:MAG: cytochrome c biogenesis protein CcdA, partial [bacterium]
QISTPAFLQRYEPSKMSGTYLGALVIGLIAGLVATPCTAPVLGVILAFVATKQKVFFGISLLFFFALGLGFLLIIIGTSAGALAALPKSGRWMVFIKKSFAIALIAIGEYYLVLTGRMLI